MIKRFFLILIPFLAHAGTVRLANDSIFNLRAVIRAADGSYLGEMVVPPLQTMSWNDYWGGIGYYSQSRTPYTVIWYCIDGTGFSVCTNVPTGSTTTALSCDGAKSCKSVKKAPSTSPKTLPPEEYLQEQEEQNSGMPQGPATFEQQKKSQQQMHQSGGPP